MLLRIITVCTIAIVALTLVCGCAPRTVSGVVYVHGRVHTAMRLLELGSHTGELFSVTQLEALVGKPELVLSEDEFYSLIKDDPGLVRYLRLVTKSDLPAPDCSDKTVWVYAWEHPMVRRGAIVGFLVYKEFSEDISYAYFTCGSKVYFAKGIER